MEKKPLTTSRSAGFPGDVRIARLFLLSACVLLACKAGSTKTREAEVVPRIPDFTPRNISDLYNPHFVRHKLKQILYDCDESMFIGDRSLEEDVVEFMASYMRCERRERINRVLLRGSAYYPFIREDFAEFGLCQHVAWGLPFVESHFDPDITSAAGALGMFQFMPMTAREFGLQDPLNWRESSRISALYLATLRKVFGKSIVLAMAAYNGGHQRLFNAIYASSKRSPHATDFVFGDIYQQLPMETRQYPGRILAAGILHTSLDELGADTLPEACEYH